MQEPSALEQSSSLVRRPQNQGFKGQIAQRRVETRDTINAVDVAEAVRHRLGD